MKIPDHILLRSHRKKSLFEYLALTIKVFCFFTGVLLLSCKTTGGHYSSVNDFGANGKDKKDDTAAFYNAFLSNVDSLQITEGTYYIHSAKINKALRADKYILGNGDVRIIDLDHGVFILLSQNNLTIKDIRFEKFRRVISVVPLRDIKLHIENCSFHGDFRNAIYSSYKSIGRLSLTVDQCLFDGMGESSEPKSRGGVWLDSRVDEVVIKNSTFKNFSSNRMARAICVSPVNKEGKDVKIINNTIDNISANQNAETQGILVFARKALIENNKLSNISANKLPSNDCEGIYTKVQYCTIKGNTLKDCGNSEGAIVVKAFDARLSPKTFIENNTISFEEDKGLTSNACGIVIRYPENSSVVNNQIKNATNIGIEITGSTAKTSNVLVEKNKIYNSGGAGLLLVGSDGTSENISIKDNLIDGANRRNKKNASAVRIVTGETEQQLIEKVVISGNEVRNVQRCNSEIFFQARFENHQIRGIEINNNILESTSEYKIFFNIKNMNSHLGKGSIEDVNVLKNQYKNNKQSILKNKERIKKLKEN